MVLEGTGLQKHTKIIPKRLRKLIRFQDRFLMLHCLLSGQRFGILNDRLYKMYEHVEDRITNVNLVKTKKSFEIIYDFI